jgi:hypothetical protein
MKIYFINYLMILIHKMYFKKKMSDTEINVIVNDQFREKPRLLFSCRFLIALILFFGASIQYIQKIDMGNLHYVLT